MGVKPLQTELAALLANLSDAQLREVDSIVEQDVRQVVWRPRPENVPQCRAYECDADVIGYGGAAGGGKSSLIYGKALMKHRRAQIFRREGTELGDLIDEIARTLGNRDGLRESPYRQWRNPTPTCELIEFGSCPHPGDEESYRGRAKDYLGIDEASLFLESQVRFLMGWVRTTVPGQKCQTVLGFNPPSDPSGDWIIAYFAPWLDDKHPNPAKDGELRWFVRAQDGNSDLEVPDGRRFMWTDDGHRTYDLPADPTPEQLVRIIRPESRTFFHARVTDNPDLLGTGYIAKLQAQPEPRRSQLLYGSFTAGKTDPPYQVIPTAWVDAAMARWVKRDAPGEMTSMGVDVAMGGKDETIIARGHDLWFDEPIALPGKDTPDGATTAAHVLAVRRDRAPIHVDAFGVGSHTYARLMEAQQQTVGVNHGNKCPGELDQSGTYGFFNERSRDWWRMREALDPANQTGIALPPHRRLRADLCAPQWKPTGSLIQVQSRDEIKAKIGRSPDYGSAYVLALRRTPKRAARFDGMGNPIPQRQRGKTGRGETSLEDYNPVAGF